MRFIEHILGTIAPHECLQCGREGSPLCRECCDSLPGVDSRCYACRRLTTAFVTCSQCKVTSALTSVHTVTLYKGAAKDLVWNLKFERQRDAAKPIAGALAQFSYAPDEIVVHVPTATSRVRQRGYDQAVQIAKELSIQTGLPRLPLLARRDQTRQVGNNKDVRKQQLRSSFVVVGDPTNKRIVLVDDVITTGSTLEVCADMLRKAGAAQVRAVVFAAA